MPGGRQALFLLWRDIALEWEMCFSRHPKVFRLLICVNLQENNMRLDGKEKNRESMPRHAFLVIAHHEPRVLMALLSQLDAEGFDVYLHLDAKATDMLVRFASYKPRLGGFCLLPQHLDVRWGHLGQVEVEMLLLKEAARHGPYAYYHILSGVDLLLKSPAELRLAFGKHPTQEYVGYWNSPAHLRDLRRKVSRHYLATCHMKDKGTLVHTLAAFVRNCVLAVQKVACYHRPVPQGVYFRKGSNWASITEEFCRYVLVHEPLLHSRLRRTLCADEIFLQTLLWSSPYRNRAYDASAEDTESSTLRKIDWKRGSPYVWTDMDISELLASPAVFARKFSSRQWAVVDALLKRTCQ
ncbi:MAG TPA: glycosyl transferase [Prevotellaceae bacterium]|nr:glycosyl transferase [Prevotellaceae bacterium]